MNTPPVIVITGAHGFVGARAMEQFRTAIPTDSQLLRAPVRDLERFIRSCQPDIILNTAAISDIGVCEKNPQDSYQANVLLPVALAKIAEITGAKLVSFSSDQVYTGCEGNKPYTDTSNLPLPKNLYARHKLEAEQRVLDIHPDAVMLRATWMYDMPLYGHPNRGNFLTNTLKAALTRRPISVPAQQHRGITYVRQVVQLLERTFELPGGVYNYGSENPLNMEETVRALLKELGADLPIRDTGEWRHDLWMDCGKLRAYGIQFDTTAQGFRRCLEDHGLL